MSGRLEVALLGPVEARLDGTAVPLPGVSARVVLARLGLSVGRAVPLADLIASLWTGEPPANAEGNVHSYISRLRRAIGSQRVVREPGGYRLNVERVEVDIGRAEQLVDDARAAVPTSVERAVDLLGAALNLWRGEPLVDLPDPLPFAPDLARLAAWRDGLREEWFELRLAAGDAAGLLPDLEHATAAAPTREGLHLLLMRALHRVGRTAEALRVGTDLRRRMIEESGLTPSPALAELERQLLTEPPGPGSGVLASDPVARATGSDARTGGGTSPAPEPEPAVAAAVRRAPPDRFVGRSAELAELAGGITEHRMVTVVGPGGVGKTRLVRELLDSRPELAPSAMAALGTVAEDGEVAAAVAAALGLQAAHGGVHRAIADRLAAQPTLVVLDNCEHVLEAAGELVGTMLESAHSRVLATSRRPLGVAGEKVVRLAPLEPAEQIELFCDRAARQRTDFDAATVDRRLAGEVCALVDGLPLGVELAARREAVFGLRQLRDRLASGLDVLEPAGEPTRTTALTATVEWSYRLLDPHSQALFDRLTVCAAGFGLDALDYVAPPEAPNPAARLADLVEASLVLPDLTVTPPRYRLLETVRTVGLTHLSVEQQAEARDAHAAWMRAHAEQIHRAQSARSADATALLRSEIGNLRAALGWLADSGQASAAARLGLLVALALTDDPHVDLFAAVRRLDPSISSVDVPPDVAGEATVAAGTVACLEGDAAAADRLLSAALAQLPVDHPYRWTASAMSAWLGVVIGDRNRVEENTIALLADPAAPAWAQGTAVCNSALIAHFTADPTGADTWMRAHDHLLAEVGQVDGFVAYTRAELAAATDPQAALRWFEQAYRQCDERGHTFNREVAAIGRAAVLIRLGRHTEAAAACRQLIGDLRRLGLWPQLWTVLRLTGELLVAMDDPEPAAALLAAADADPLAPAVLRADQERHAELWSRLAEALPPHRLDAARAGGQAGGRVAAAQLGATVLDRHG